MKLSDLKIGQILYTYYISNQELTVSDVMIISIGFKRDTIIGCTADGEKWYFKVIDGRIVEIDENGEVKDEIIVKTFNVNALEVTEECFDFDQEDEDEALDPAQFGYREGESVGINADLFFGFVEFLNSIHKPNLEKLPFPELVVELMEVAHKEAIKESTNKVCKNENCCRNVQEDLDN